MIGKCRSLSTYKRITLVYNRVTDFIKVKHHRSDMYAAEIDGSFVDDFSDYLFTTYKVSNNQVQKIMQVFKHVTKICIKKGLLKKDPFSDYKIKFAPVDPNFLTVDELKLIIQKKFSLRSLETTKDLFVFSCFTGLAFVDAMNLKRENITLAENGDMWIKITRQKTNIPSISCLILTTRKRVRNSLSIESIDLFPRVKKAQTILTSLKMTVQGGQSE